MPRLQKVLAHAGVGSRRACEELILQGRVTVNGQTIRELGTRVDPSSSKIAVDGQVIQEERHVYYAVHKPKGYVSTNNDPAGRPRVVDLVPALPQRVYTVGRLDESSTGLILLTNDGELANRLTHPRFGVEKRYRVVVAGQPSPEVLTQLTDGIWLAEGKVRAQRVKVIERVGQSTILEMVLAEGKNREVRRMLARFGHKVMSLTRVSVGPITIKGLKSGRARSLTSREVALLRKAARMGGDREHEQPPEQAAGSRKSGDQRPPRKAARPSTSPAPSARTSRPPAKPAGSRPTASGPLRSNSPPPPNSRQPRRNAAGEPARPLRTVPKNVDEIEISPRGTAPSGGSGGKPRVGRIILGVDDPQETAPRRPPARRPPPRGKLGGPGLGTGPGSKPPSSQGRPKFRAIRPDDEEGAE